MELINYPGRSARHADQGLPSQSFSATSKPYSFQATFHLHAKRGRTTKATEVQASDHLAVVEDKLRRLETLRIELTRMTDACRGVLTGDTVFWRLWPITATIVVPVRIMPAQ